jgi:hypothetical protein
MPNAVPAMLRIALQAGECRSNDEVRMSNRCNFCWLHSVDSVRFSAFSAPSAVQKAKALRAIRDIRVIRGFLLSVSLVISV